VHTYLASRIFGGPDSVRHRLGELLRLTAADEVMVVTITHDHLDRVRSCKLLAQQATRTL